jgi:hypothetical protein
VLAIEAIGHEPSRDIAGERRRDRVCASALHKRDEQAVMDDGSRKADAEKGDELTGEAMKRSSCGHSLSITI